MLYVGGCLARAVYEAELDAICKEWITSTEKDGSVEEQFQQQLIGRAAHVMKFFTFYPSTPSASVSTIMETSFSHASTIKHSQYYLTKEC